MTDFLNTFSDDEALRSFDIQASYDGGRGWQYVARDLPPEATSFDWLTPPSVGVDDVRVRVIVRDLRFQNSSDGTNVSFSITSGCIDQGACNDNDVCTMDECDTGTCVFSPNAYGDTNGSGVVDLDDILCVIAGFGFFDNCPGGDVAPACTGDGLIDLDDILGIIAAFGGDDPCCGGAPSAPATPGRDPRSSDALRADPAVISLLASNDLIRPRQTSSIDVFITGVADLSGYQVAVSVSGGTAGRVDVASVSIDVASDAYVFAGLQSFEALDPNGGRLAGALLEGGVSASEPRYLGTIEFHASPDAEGSYEIAIRPEATLLRDPQSGALDVRISDPLMMTVR